MPGDAPANSQYFSEPVRMSMDFQFDTSSPYATIMPGSAPTTSGASTPASVNLDLYIDSDIARQCEVVQTELNVLDKAMRDHVMDLCDHIVICGMDSDMYDLVMLLRAKKLKEKGMLRPIVILAPEEPPQVIWNRLCIFSDLYFVQGSATTPTDLKRAGVDTAFRIIILTSQTTVTAEAFSVPAHCDAKSILAFRMIKQMTSSEVSVELGLLSRFLSHHSSRPVF
jgi:hypothetical protein